MKSFKFRGCVVNKRGTDDVDINSKVVQGRKVVGVINAILNATGVSWECAR